jgi:hypothetical protein
MRPHQLSIIRSKREMASIDGKRNGHRKLRVPVLNHIYVLLASPAGALLFSILGYYAFAGISNAFTPDTNVGSISIWALLLAIASMAFLEGRNMRMRKLYVYYIPAFVFFVFYTYRILENFFNLGMELFPGPLNIMLLLFGGAIFPALLHASLAGGIRDQQFITATIFLCVIFLVSIGLNFEELTASLETRLQMQKVNPIPLAYQALWLIVILVFYLKRSWSVATLSVICIPIFAYIVLYSQSRGPIVSVFGALFIYLILQRTKSRLNVLLSSSLVLTFVTLLMGPSIFSIFTSMIERTDVVLDESTALHYLAAEGAWQQFLEDPLFGRYLIELNTQFYPHNIYLEALMSVGLIGALPFYWHLGLSVRAAVGLIRMHNQITAVKVLCFLFFGHCIAAGISGSIWGATGFWILSITLIALWYGTPRHAAAQSLKEN